MRDGIPLVYRTFRNSWTVLHVVLVLAGAIALIRWGITDGNAERVLSGFVNGLLDLQYGVASLVPWPWEVMF